MMSTLRKLRLYSPLLVLIAAAVIGRRGVEIARADF